MVAFHPCPSMCIHISVYVYVFLSSISRRPHGGLSVRVSLCLCACIYLSVRLYLSVCVPVFICLPIRVSIYGIYGGYPPIRASMYPCTSMSFAKAGRTLAVCLSLYPYTSARPYPYPHPRLHPSVDAGPAGMVARSSARLCVRAGRSGTPAERRRFFYDRFLRNRGCGAFAP